MAKLFEKLPTLKQDVEGSLQADAFLANIPWLIFNCIKFCQELLSEGTSILTVSGYSSGSSRFLNTFSTKPFDNSHQTQELVLPPASN